MEGFAFDDALGGGGGSGSGGGAATKAAAVVSLEEHGIGRGDGIVVDDLLSPRECERLVEACERSCGFGWWDPSVDAGSSSSGGGEKKTEVRNADTLELDDPALCTGLWRRLAPFMPPSVAIGREDAERYEHDLEGTWDAAGLNPHLLVNRYGPGGHFAPHADGSTIRDFNHRSLYTVLIYLNDCAEGGATLLLTDEHGDTSELLEAPGSGGGGGGALVRVARPAAVLHAVRPHKGRALMYYHQQLHSGETVGAGCQKYCLRTDIMYRRREPLCTAPNDLEAFALVQRAGAHEAAGEVTEARACYRRAASLSRGIAKAYRLD